MAPQNQHHDPFRDVRILALSTIHGVNYWTRKSVTQLDIDIGPYEDISSADIPGTVDQLLAFLPTLGNHFCSIGTLGGFVQRLRDGTYMGHITEHVALELQELIGHRVGFGRTRAAGKTGEYTIVLEHKHDVVGLRSATLALDIVQRAFAGTLVTNRDDPRGTTLRARILAELHAVASTAPSSPRSRHVACAITGSAGRAALGIEIDHIMHHEGIEQTAVDLSPAYLLRAGLSYTSSDFAVILDTTPIDVPAYYRAPERAAQLVSVVADAVPEGGTVICPNNVPLLHDRIRSAGRRIEQFTPSPDVATNVANALACVQVLNGTP